MYVSQRTCLKNVTHSFGLHDKAFILSSQSFNERHKIEIHKRVVQLTHGKEHTLQILGYFKKQYLRDVLRPRY